MCVHFLHALLALVCRCCIQTHIQYSIIFDITGTKMFGKKEKHVEWANNAAAAAVDAALHYIVFMAHTNAHHRTQLLTTISKAHRHRIFALRPFPLSLVKFMVTLQMSIILWPNCCRYRCCWKWWDFHFLILTQSNSLGAFTMCIGRSHCLLHAASLLNTQCKIL